MSAKDRHYKPRRFKDENESAADKKLKGSKAAKKYMAERSEEIAPEPGQEKETASSVRYPSRVNVPADEAPAVRPVSRRPAAAPAKASEPETPAKAAEPAAPIKPAEPETPAKPAESEAKAPEVSEKAKSAEADAPDSDSDSSGASEKGKDFDYVVPHSSHRKHKKHHKSISSGSSTKTSVTYLDDKENDELSGDYVFENDNPDKYTQRQHKKKKKKKSKVKTVLISILCVLLALIVGVVGTFFVMREIGRGKMHDYSKIEIDAPEKDESGNQIDTLDATGRIINYGGKSYEFNDNVISVVFIGADKGMGKEAEKQMGDAIYVLTVDVKSGATKILGISRDTMADVDLYSGEGRFIDTEKLQLAYAYNYSTKDMTGGQNTLTSVSRLFYGLPMKDYFAINLEALNTINDAIGGVTLTSGYTFTSPEDGRLISEGETVTLHGKEAEAYVRHRDTEQLDSNNDRMKLQQQYITSFIASIFPAAKKDISVVTDLYNAIKDNSDTSLDITKLTYIASTALSHLKSASDIEYIKLEGKVEKGEYAEYYVSNEETITKMLDIFYKPIEFAPIKQKSTE